MQKYFLEALSPFTFIKELPLSAYACVTATMRGGGQTWAAETCMITPTPGFHDVYLVYAEVMEPRICSMSNGSILTPANNPTS